MTRDEVIDLLTIVTSYDNRTVGQSTITAWLDAATVARWTFDEAAGAVRRHYAERADWIMPGHVTQSMRAVRRDAMERAAVPSQALDAGLLRRIEALADSKAIDAPAPPRPLAVGRGCRDVAGERVAEAMARGEQARRAHEGGESS